MREELIRLENIVKNDKDIRILNDFNLNIFKGEILGLFSLNTVGKSSLLDILCKKIKIDAGRIYLKEKPIYTNDDSLPYDSRAFIIENKSKLSSYLTVADNIFVIRNGLKQYIINDEELFNKTELFFKEFDIKINPRRNASKLSVLERCTVELIKAFALDASLIILNDLSSSLSTADLWKFNRLVIKMRFKGISFLYIDSDLDILFNMAERIVIMRDGKNIRTFRKDDFKEKNIMSVLMGNEFNVDYNRVVDIGKDEIVRFKNLTSKYLEDFSLNIYENEIVSLVDAGSRSNNDILKIMTVELPAKSGEIYISGKKYCPTNEKDILNSGVGVICENPVEKMLFEDWSVVENLYFRMALRIKNLWLKPRIKKSIVQEYYNKFGNIIYENNLRDLDAASLYKIVYYSWHLFSPKLLICVKPFTGLDIYLRNLVQEMMDELTKRGITIIILSSNITEAYILGDRIVVLDKNKISGEYKKREFSLQRLKDILSDSPKE